MTAEEIESIRKQRKSEYDAIYRQTERYMQKNRERSKMRYAIIKERMISDPVFREEQKSIWRKYNKSKSRRLGRPFTMTEEERRNIELLHNRGCRVSVIAQRTLLSYHTVYHYVHSHIRQTQK